MPEQIIYQIPDRSVREYEKICGKKKKARSQNPE